MRFTLVLLVLLFAAACDDSSGPESPGPADAILKIQGDGQTGGAGEPLQELIGIRIADAGGRGIPNRIIEYAVTSGEGTLLAGTSTTDSKGESRNQWTLGTRLGVAQSVSVRTLDPTSGREFVTDFTATVVAGEPAAVEVVSGNGQLGAAGTTLPEPLTVRVADRFDNPAVGISVDWRITGGSGSVTPFSAATNQEGRSSTTWTLGTEFGSAHFVEAAVEGLGPATFWAEAASDHTWEPVASMPIATTAAAGAALGGKIYIVGGGVASQIDALQIFDVASGTWSLGPSVPVATSWWNAAVLDGKIHAVGGVTSATAASNQHWVYDPIDRSWSEGAAMPKAAAGSGVVSVGSELIVIGGIDGPGDYAGNTMVYNATSGEWRMGAPVPSPRINWSGFTSGGMVYAVGGGVPGRQTTDQLLRYSPSGDAWEVLAPIPARREAHGFAGVGNMLCAIGGRLARSGNFNTPFDSTYCYWLGDGRWVPAGRLPRARQEIVAVAVGDYVYAFGGRDAQRRVLSDVTRIKLR